MNVPKAASEFLRALGSSARAVHLYPEGHPVRQDHLSELDTLTFELLRDSGFDFFVYDDSFFFEDALMAKESLTYQWLLQTWQRIGIESLSVQPDARSRDLRALVLYIAEEGPSPEGAIEINTADLTRKSQTDKIADPIHKAYADTLNIMREVAEGVKRGTTPKLGAAATSVDSLIKAVLGDPQSALLMSTIRAHHESTFFHMVNVCMLSIATGASIGLPRHQLLPLGMGALLHDVGKVAIPQETLNTSGPLSAEDWIQIRRHPIEGASVLLQSWERIDPQAAAIAHQHHIRHDGEGYPDTGSKERPNLLSKIVTVADVFDALTTKRSYRLPDTRERALEVLLSGANSHFDPRIVRVFVRMMGFYPPGSVIELGDGSIAVVIRNNEELLDRPVVVVTKDPKGNPVEPRLIDLAEGNAEDPTNQIVRGINADMAGVEPADLI